METADRKSWHNNDSFIQDITGCARCGQPHTQLTFQRLDGQLVDMVMPLTNEERQELGTPSNVVHGIATHWALCPTLGQPILFIKFNSLHRDEL